MDLKYGFVQFADLEMDLKYGFVQFADLEIKSGVFNRPEFGQTYTKMPQKKCFVFRAECLEHCYFRCHWCFALLSRGWGGFWDVFVESRLLFGWVVVFLGGRSHWSEESKRKSDKQESARRKSLNSWCKATLGKSLGSSLIPKQPGSTWWVFLNVTH